MTTEEEGFDRVSVASRSGTASPKSDGQSPSALADLLARVQAAEGPDRELDSLIAIATRDGAEGYPNYPLGSFGPGLVQANMGRDGWSVGWRVPAYTASLDAALALCERVLPGWIVARIGQQDDRSWWVEMRKGFLTSYSAVAMSDTRVRFKSPALALIAAILKALVANGQDGTAERQTEPREDPDRPQPIKPKTHNHSGKGAEDVG